MLSSSLLITIRTDIPGRDPEVGTYLVAPPKAAVPSGLDEGITVLRQPLDRIYLAATSAMDLFRELDSLAAIRLSGTKAQDWYVEEARAAMEAGEILYAGKYSAPDYERIYARGATWRWSPP